MGGKAERSLDGQPDQPNLGQVDPKPMERTGDPLVRISLRDDRGRKYHVSVQASQVGEFIRPQQA